MTTVFLDIYAYKILTELAAVAEVAGRTLAGATRLVAGVMHYARSAVLTLTRHTRILCTHTHTHTYTRAHTYTRGILSFITRAMLC